MLKNLEMLIGPAELTHASDNLNLQRRNAELRGGCAAGTTSSVTRRWPISPQHLECDFAMPVAMPAVHSYSLLYLLLFCETRDLVWEIVFLKRKNKGSVQQP